MVLFPGLAGPIIFIGGLVLMFLVVPWERIKELSLIGIVGGLGIAIVLIYIMQNALGLWTFFRVDLVNISGIPLFLAASWFPLIVLFSHFLNQYKNMPLLASTLLAFPLGATLLHLFLIANGMLVYTNWNLALTFILSLGIHLAITLYLYATGQLENLRLFIK